MEVSRTLVRSEKKTAVALGYFDGVHLAHMQVINKTVAFKASNGYIPTVFTFTLDNINPRKGDIKSILSEKTKIDIFGRFGVKKVYMPNFSELIAISAEDFLQKIILEKLNAGALVCGYDYTFGKDAVGDTDMLADFCAEKGIELCMINPMQRHGEVISSTRIRSLIEAGRIVEANDMLGYSYFIKAPVEIGNKLGRTLGFPTMNQSLDPEQITPKLGVYNSTVYIDEKIYKGVTNIGIKPTIDQSNRKISVETHVVGLNHDVYGEDVIVSLNKFMRPEECFESKEALQKAMKSDLDQLFFR